MQVKPKSWTVDIVVGPVTGKSHARQHTPGSKHAPAAKREPVYDREKSPLRKTFTGSARVSFKTDDLRVASSQATVGLQFITEQ